MVLEIFFYDGSRKILELAQKFKVSKIAREAISRALEDLVPTIDTPKREIEAIKRVIYKSVLFVAEHYNGRYDQVPNLYLSERLRKCTADIELLEARREILYIADVVDAVRRRSKDQLL